MNLRSPTHYRRASVRGMGSKDAALSLSAQLMLLVTCRQWRLVHPALSVTGRTRTARRSTAT